LLGPAGPAVNRAGESGHRPRRPKDLDAVLGADRCHRVGCYFVERGDVFDEALKAGRC
jgi:hypothetical protein